MTTPRPVSGTVELASSGAAAASEVAALGMEELPALTQGATT